MRSSHDPGQRLGKEFEIVLLNAGLIVLFRFPAWEHRSQMRMAEVEQDVGRGHRRAQSDIFADPVCVRILDVQNVAGDDGQRFDFIRQHDRRRGQLFLNRPRTIFLHGITEHANPDRRRNDAPRHSGPQSAFIVIGDFQPRQLPAFLRG